MQKINSASNTEGKRKYKINKSLVIRNKKIREDFLKLKKEGVVNRDALVILSEKYFLSEHTVNSIVYSQN